MWLSSSRTRRSRTTLRAAGIRVPKFQISAGLRLPLSGDNKSDAALLDQLERFADSTYLHQVVEAGDGELRRYLDLPEAIASARETPRRCEWRIHFHVPLFREKLGVFQSTQAYVAEMIALLQSQPERRQHWEVETYTWDVLPEEHRGERVADAIAREMQWVLSQTPRMNGRGWLRLGRVSNLPTVWTNALAGMVLAGAPLSLPTFLLVALAFSLFYEGGMYLNDAFDRKIDAVQRPERPIPSGAVTAGTVYAIGYGLLLAGLAVLLVVGGRERHLEALASGAGARGGDRPLRRMAQGQSAQPRDHGDGAGTGVRGSRRGGDGQGAGGGDDGRRGAARLSHRPDLYGEAGVAGAREELVAAGLPGGALCGRSAGGGGVGVGAVLYLGFVASVAYAVSLLVRKPRRVPLAVVSLIAGISLLDGVLIAMVGATDVALLAVGGFLLTLALQRVVPGT